MPSADNGYTGSAWEGMYLKTSFLPTPESLQDNHPIDEIPTPAFEKRSPVPKTHQGKNKLPKKAGAAIELPEPLFVSSH